MIYYSTNGTTPTTSSSVYSTPITVATSETLKAIATATGYSASEVANAAYTIASSGSGTGEWTWMGGSSTLSNSFGSPGMYGTLGTPAARNIPGSRQYSVSWTDPTGNLWLFGGLGGNQGNVVFNDLWEFNPSTNEWAWISGSSTQSCPSFCGSSGVYGTIGKPAVGNVPGGRWSASNWTDSSGHLWLFGGDGYDANGVLGFPDDLWEFNPSTNLWTWMGGSSTNPVRGEGLPPVYGTQGAFAAGNNPGGRYDAATWTDNGGHFWLYGGIGYYATGVAGALNDLWEFDPSINQWAWMGGSNTAGGDCPGGLCVHPGVYGTLGMPAAGNNPGSRDEVASWTDSGGHLWLFGGSIPGVHLAYLDDLWEFFPSTNEWAWMGGGSKPDQPGVYGTLGAPAAGNIPGGRCCTVGWADNSGHLWLFGGQGYDAEGNQGDLNDLWQFDLSTNQWAWMGGSSSPPCGRSGCFAPGVYGTLGVPAAGDIPGSRQDAVSWTDKSGNFWLFGGSGADANGSLGNLNDLWRYGSAATTLPVAATPAFSPPAGSYTTAQTVTISDTTTGAVIYYTTSGATPTAGSSKYGGPIPVSSTETIEAIATATGYTNSAVSSATYTFPVPTTTALTAQPASLSYGQHLTLTATVKPVSGPAPAGTVTFYSGTVSLGTADLNGSGVATLTLTPAVGSYSITTSYGGSSTDAPSASSPPIAVAVKLIATTTALTASSQTLFLGQTLTLTAPVTPASGAMPAGSVTFKNGPVSLATANLNSDGIATLNLKPGIGNYSITASYGGSADDAASTSAPVLVNVISSPTTTTLTASLNPAPFGGAVTILATVASSTGNPAGSVSFYDGSALLTTATLTSGMASYSTRSLSVGSHNLTASYAGAPGFNSSKSNVVVEVISPADFSIAASPSEQTVYTGEAASYSVMIKPGVGFSLPVALSCTQLPANTTCAFSPATVSSGSGSSKLTVQTTPPQPGAASASLRVKTGFTLLAGFMILFIPRRLRRHRNSWLMFFAILASLVMGAAISGCGAPGSLAGGTPVGTQVVAITATATNGAQSLSHTAKVTLNVKSLF